MIFFASSSMSTRRNTPLTSNGAPTRTQALLPGSQAINTGSNPLGLATDQQGTGFPRVLGGIADMDAYEW